MREYIKQKKNASKIIGDLPSEEEIAFGEMAKSLVLNGKQQIDEIIFQLGKTMIESLFYIEREEIAGPDYSPKEKDIYKWASQPGSVYMMGQKVKVNKPRLRGPDGEISLKTYEALKSKEAFSAEIIAKLMNGLSGRRYKETLIEIGEAFGVSASSVSRTAVEISAKKLKEFNERSLGDFRPFAIFLDGYHLDKSVFIVALGVDLGGNKRVLGLTEGATENHEVCKTLFSDLQRRGLEFSKRTLYVTDGGSGVIKSLKELHGKKLLHQRCTIHKQRNILGHLPKRWQSQALRMYTNAVSMVSYGDAKTALLELQEWLRQINESAAASLDEALEELLLVHRLGITGALRKTLYTTNPIESMFNMVAFAERNVKTYKGSKMTQRRLASALLHSEKRFRRIKGYKEISLVLKNIELYINSIDKG